jgi:hypothetical protein
MGARHERGCLALGSATDFNHRPMVAQWSVALQFILIAFKHVSRGLRIRDRHRKVVAVEEIVIQRLIDAGFEIKGLWRGGS